MRVKFIYLY